MSGSVSGDDVGWWLAVLALLGIAGWIARRFRHRWLAAIRPPVALPIAAGTSSAGPSSVVIINYEAEIRALLRAGLMAAGWEPRGRQLSVTAREIIFRMIRNDPRTPALGEIVRVAELVRFAGVAADATLYERARAAYVAMRSGTSTPAREGSDP